MVISQTFGEWVRSRRRTLDLTREQLALRVGCSVATLRKIEDDERRPSLQVAELLARGLDIAAEYSDDFVKVARGTLGVQRLARISNLAHGAGVSPVPTAPRNNLPILPTPLIGRQRELAELHQLVSDPHCRMLTLVGPGGIGKTRLAIEAASALQDNFADGVYFVPLAPVDSSRFVVPVIAHSIGFAFPSTDSADPRTQLLAYLQDKHLLLLVDNMEHLLDEPGVKLFADLLACAPDVKVLVTSRASLDIQAEWVLEVKGLPLPEDSEGQAILQDTSVELFLQRARRAHVGFGASSNDLPAILRICRLVGGVPLAIELAAAWVRTLTCVEIAEEIERGLDFLNSSARDLPARHRSMRAVFDHSWKLLSDDERRALARLSVFRGGFERQAASRVAGASLPLLSLLVAKSLVRRPEMGRYDLHELIRQYAALHLEVDPAEGAAARQQHYAFFLALAEGSAPQLKGSSQLDCLRLLEQEHDNFRAALEWSLYGDRRTPGSQDDSALLLAGALRWFWEMRGYFHEGRSWLMKALQQGRHGLAAASPVSVLTVPDATSGPDDQRARARARALEGLALLDNSLGNHADANALADRSLAIYAELGDKQGQADVLMVAGQALRWQGHAARSHSRLEQALTLYRELGDRWNVARSLFRLGQDKTDFGGDAGARAMLEESSIILEELGESYLFIGVLAARGVIAVNTGDYTSARSYFDRALAMARELRDPWGAAHALTNIGCILRIQGDYPAARSHLEEALRVYEQSGRGTWWADPRCALAENEIVQGNLHAARLHLREASPWVETSGNRWLQVLVGYFEGLLAYYEEDMERAATSLEKTIALAREGQYQPDLARALISLGRVRRAQGEAARAVAPLLKGLRLFSEAGSKLGIATALEAFAGLAAPKNPEHGVRWFGTADAIRSAIGAHLPPVDRLSYDRDITSVRAQIGEAPFTEAWERGHAESYEAVVEELLAFYNSAD